MSFQKTVLESGLIIATENLPGLATTTVSVNVSVGSRDETPEEQGISHLLEHMAFKGTQNRNARELAEAFDEIGGHNNAYTSSENTVYYAKVMADDAGLAAGILGDILTRSTFDAEELEKERGVILQEIAMHRDMPEEYAGDVFQETAFSGQPLGRSILGTEGHIAAFSRADLIDYMQHGYSPDRIIVTAAGKVEHALIVEAVEAAFSGLTRSAHRPRVAAHYTGGDWRESHDLEQVHLFLGLPAFSIYDDDYCALQLLNTILGGGISSRLFQEVREVRGLAYHVQSFTSSYTDTGTFGIYTATGPDDVEELIPVIAGEMLAMTHAVSEAELARAKKQHLAGLAMARESTTAVAEWIGRHLMIYGEYRTLERLKAGIDKVTLSDIFRVAGRLLENTNLTIAAYGPIQNLPEHDRVVVPFKR